ncbi:MAG TPA: BTAD domain-containing putative transcriptional regulator [Actinocrinis sp.]|nr:BTAD domain-containing putative transcriptional regulator [Actinocrinis sp.]
MMEFRLLGPTEVLRAGVPVPVGAAKLRALLGTLLIDADCVVSADRLTEALWPRSRPPSVTSSLHNHVLRLRRLLDPQDGGSDPGQDGGRIRAVPPGYLIRVAPGELDLHTFAARCADGRDALRESRWHKAAADLTAALALWRGAPFAGIPGLDGEHPRIEQLAEMRLQALEGRTAAELELGRHLELIGELRTLAATHPLRESFHGALMLALYRAGREAEALDVFLALRRTLVDELGVEPSARTQDLHGRILRSDPGLMAGAGTDGAARPAPAPGPGAELSGPGRGGRPGRAGAPGLAGPAGSLDTAGQEPFQVGPRFQLPADTHTFTGRDGELEELSALALGSAGEGTVVLSAINGMAGIGKTSLALRAAHRVRGSFPDGQLFLDLHGHTPGLTPIAPDDALERLLRSLGVPPQSIPQGLDERAGLYRHTLADTKTLIVLDNAASSAQVRPLLPGTAGCLVLITSRRRLTGLDDARTIAVGTLPTPAAAELLHRIAGPGRIPPDHPGAAELISLCGNLPLALRITAARLRHHRTLRIEDVVDQLRDENSRLDYLQDEDRNLAAVFESSYAALPAAEQTVFRRLGLVPGPDFDAHAVANLAAVDFRAAQRLLESLLNHNLVLAHAPGRYRLHDLLRTYARTLANAEPEQDRNQAVGRLLDYYEHTADSVFAKIDRRPRSHGAAAGAVLAYSSRQLADRREALRWMHLERDNLIAVVDLVGSDGLDSRGTALTDALGVFLRKEGPWELAVKVHRTAVDTARRRGDRRGQADALADLGSTQSLVGGPESAMGPLGQALAIYREVGDRGREADVLLRSAEVWLGCGAYPAAADLIEQASVIYRETGDQVGEAGALQLQGRLQQTYGDYQAAADARARALAICQAANAIDIEADILYDQGRMLEVTCDYPAALAAYTQGLAKHQALGNRRKEAIVLWRLGRLSATTGDGERAVTLYEQATSLLHMLGDNQIWAYVLGDLSRVLLVMGDPAAAADRATSALGLFQRRNDRHGEANALQDLGRARHAAGEHRAAQDLLRRSLAAFQEVGDRQGEAEVGNSLGALAADTAGPDQALVHFRQALELARAVRSPLDEARALDGIARCDDRLGKHPSAVAHLDQALAVYRRIGAAEAEAAAAQLADWQARYAAAAAD